MNGRTFTWDQIGRLLMAFEGFTPNAIVEDTIEIVVGPLLNGRLGSQASGQPAPTVPAPAAAIKCLQARAFSLCLSCT